MLINPFFGEETAQACAIAVHNSYPRNHLRLDAKEKPPGDRAAILC